MVPVGPFYLKNQQRLHPSTPLSLRHPLSITDHAMSYSQMLDCKGFARPLFRGFYGATAPYFMHVMWMLPQFQFPTFLSNLPPRLQLEDASKPSSSTARASVEPRDVLPAVTESQGPLSFEWRSSPPPADQPPRTPNFSSIQERQPSSRLRDEWAYPSPSSSGHSPTLDRPSRTATTSLTRARHASISLNGLKFDPFAEEEPLEVDHGYHSNASAESSTSGSCFAHERNATSAIFKQIQATNLEDYLMTVITKSSEDAPVPVDVDPPHVGTTCTHSQNLPRTLIAPTPLRSRPAVLFLDSSPTPRLPAGFLDDLSSETLEHLFAKAIPALSRPDLDNMNTLIAGTFKKVEECKNKKCLVTFWAYVFGFWNGGELIRSGCGTSSSALEWTEFISGELIVKLRHRLEEIAITSLDFSLVTDSLDPLLEFIVDLHGLNEPFASRARQTLFVFLERQFASPDVEISLPAQLIGYLFEYYQEKSLDNPKVSERILDDLYKRLHSLIECNFETTQSELDYSECQKPTISLAYFLKYLRVETLIDVRRLMPNKLVTRFLSFPCPDHHCGMDAVFEYSRSKACATLIVLACSDLRRPGCVGCSRTSDDLQVRNSNSNGSLSCVCSLNVPILNDEFRRVRSYVRQGDLSHGLEALLHLEAVDYGTRIWEHMVAARQLHTIG